MNNRKIKIIAYIYIHFSLSLVEKSPRRSHLQANKESTHSGRSNSGTASTFTTSNQIGEIHVFDVKFRLRHVAWHNVVHGSMNKDEHLMVHLRRF